MIVVAYAFVPDNCFVYDEFGGRNLFENGELLWVTDNSGSRVMIR